MRFEGPRRSLLPWLILLILLIAAVAIYFLYVAPR